MIFTIDTNDAFHARVVEALHGTRWADSLRHCASVEEALEELRSGVIVSAVVVGPDVRISDATRLASAAMSTKLAPAVFLVSDPSTEVLRQAMRAGIRDVLPPRFDAEELTTVFEEAGVATRGPAPLPGLTTVVFSTKGGVGTSVLASNLAVRVAARSAVPTTLIDLDLASADQAVLHGIQPKWTIQDVVDGSIGQNAESLDQVLRPIPGSAAKLLPGPIDPALAETITAVDVAATVARARTEAPFVIIDTAASFDDRSLAALDAADIVVLVTSLDVAALRGLTVALRTLRHLGFDDDRLRIVMVRADSKAGLHVADVERTIGRSIDVHIPSTRAIPRSVNEGIPLAVSSPRSGAVQAIDELAAVVVGLAPDVVTAGTGEVDRGGLMGLGRRLSNVLGSDDQGSSPESHEAAAEDGSRDLDEPQNGAVSVDIPGVATVSPSSPDADARGVADQPAPRPVRRVRRAKAEEASTSDGPDSDLTEDPEDDDPRAQLLKLPPPAVDDDSDDDNGRPHRRHARRR